MCDLGALSPVVESKVGIMTQSGAPIKSSDRLRNKDSTRILFVDQDLIQVNQFQIATSEEFNNMCDLGALSPVVDGKVGIATPLGASIKSSDRLRTKDSTRISFVDQDLIQVDQFQITISEDFNNVWYLHRRQKDRLSSCE